MYDPCARISVVKDTLTQLEVEGARAIRPLGKEPFLLADEFPFGIAHFYYTSYYEMQPHKHAELEIIYNVSGRGYLFVEDEMLLLRPGDIAITSSEVVHKVLPDPKQPGSLIVIMFKNKILEYLNNYQEICNIFYNDSLRRRIRLDQENDQLVKGILENLLCEFEHENLFYQELIKAKLAELLVILHRLFIVGKKEEEVNEGVGERVEEVIEFIEANLGSKITVDDIANAVHLSASHLSSLFKQKTGLTIYSFIISKRLILARKLLMETEKSVETIAEECGFNDVSSFIRCFRERVGTTPGQYRRGSR